MWIFLLIVFYCCSSYDCIPFFVSCKNSSACSSVTFQEELLPGTVVETFTFSDSDVQQLKFSIILQGTNLMPVNYLSLNCQNFVANVVIGSRIDYEDFTQNQRSLFFALYVFGNQTTVYTFYVAIIDIDDNPPVFSKTTVYCSMPENTLSANCSNLVVSDADTINSIMYLSVTSSTTGSISDFYVLSSPSQYTNNHFVKNFSIGLNTVLNYQVARLVQIIVQAMDSANHTSLCSIFITVINIPKLPPVFQNLPYTVVMNEAQPQNTNVITVLAIDGDTGINNSITYNFASNPFNQYFALNSTTGVITIANVIIRENTDISKVYGIFNLTVIASKNVTIAANSSQATVFIQILDVNNQPAIFSQSIYNATIPENSAPGTTVLVKPQILVTDNDYGSNAQFLTQAFQNGSLSNIFGVYPTQGIYSVMLTIYAINSSYLNFKNNPFISITIVANQIAPVFNIPVSTSTTVNIAIQPVNRFTPTFINPSYNFSILENSPLYAVVGQVSAVDQDGGLFGTITYQLVDSTNKFAINSSNGYIFVNVNASFDLTLLDFEKVTTYYMFAQAIDGGGLMSVVSVIISLQDVNDNPPVFQFKVYYGRIQENSLNLFPNPFQVKATDVDAIPLVTYKLVNITNDAPTFLSSFNVNNNSGIITVVNPLDREALNQNNGNWLIILVQAYDPTNPNFFDFATLQIFVEDVNDNIPILTSTVYSATISQNVLIDDSIFYVKANDVDQYNTSNSFIFYQLVGNDASSFVLQALTNSSKGAFILKRSNANLRPRIYNFTVVANDGGVPQLSSSANVLITVEVFNSRSPVFNQTLYQFNVNENVPLGTFVGQLVATDADLNNNLTYSLSTAQLKAWNSSNSPIESIYNFTTTFAINASNGVITTMAPLDREQVVKIELLVLVVDNAAQTPNQTATATINVLINDLNDNPPIFTANIFYLNILEDFSVKNNVTSGATGLFTTATDKDITGVLTYNYTQVNQSFIVDPVTAQVFLIVGLDREKVPFINFTVSCTDGIHWTNVVVSVIILDVNDNEPVFNGFISNFTILQTTPVGTLLAKFNATDLDSGQHAVLVFRQIGGDMTQFALSPDGSFTVAQPLLQITKFIFMSFVEVYDDPTGPYHLRSDKEIGIYITVTNIAPVFDSPTYQYIIPENVILGFKLDTIAASDNNLGANGIVDYYLILPSSNPNTVALSLFAMTYNSTKAQIFVNSSLQYKAGLYVLILQAKDRGTPPLNNNCTLYINVTAVNYFAPNFTNPIASVSINQSTPVFYIMENTIGTIAIISAYDPDEGVNGVVRFGLDSGDLNNANFSIDPINGTLTNVAPFIRLTKAVYGSRIRANDLGSPSLTTYITIQVVVLDVGNKPPVFLASNKTINLSITEGPQSASPIINTTLSGFKIGSIAVATSYNLGYNATICYCLLTNPNNMFYLVPYTGDLFGLKPFNWAIVSSYQIWIKALHVSQCNNGSVYLNTNYNPSDPSVAMLYLQIIDINDNPPYFNQSLIIVRMPKGYLSGSIVIDFSKYSGDVDQVSQGNLVYSIQGDVAITSPLRQHMALEQITQYFSLNSTSGILSIGTSVSFLNTMDGNIQVTVVVSDGKFQNTTSFMTYLVSQNDTLVITITDFLPKVASIAWPIASYYSQQLAVMVYFDGLELCADGNGTLISPCTYMYIYGFNTSTNTVVNAPSLLNLFNTKKSVMSETLAMYKITSIVPYNPNKYPITDTASIQQASLYRLILIICCCICILILIIMGTCIYVARSNYLRKLKAYTTSSSDHTTELKSMTIPGTNIYENYKNPFAGTANLGNSNDVMANTKKYGVPIFGSGITLERNNLTITGMDESQVIESTETIF